jgi:hypothetical protein
MDRSRHGHGIARQYAAPRQRSRALIFICLTCFTGTLAASWAASPFRAHGLFSFSAWLAALAAKQRSCSFGVMIGPSAGAVP